MLSTGLLDRLTARFSKVLPLIVLITFFSLWRVIHPPAWLIFLLMLGDDVVWAYMSMYTTKFLVMEYSKLPNISMRFTYIPNKSARRTSGLLLGSTSRRLSFLAFSPKKHWFLRNPHWVLAQKVPCSVNAGTYSLYICLHNPITMDINTLWNATRYHSTR
jgi:hypothetical protein